MELVELVPWSWLSWFHPGSTTLGPAQQQNGKTIETIISFMKCIAHHVIIAHVQVQGGFN